MRACKPLAVAALFVLMLAPAAFAQQASPAGRIKVVTGSAFIVRNNSTVPARAGDGHTDRLASSLGGRGGLGRTTA